MSTDTTAPKAARLTVTKAARSHKSKAEQKRKSTARVINGGFLERVRKPVLTGAGVKSMMVRCDAGFALWVRDQAKAAGVSITEVTRALHADLTTAAE